MVRDWNDAEIVLILKKGDLSDCNNWRGISLLDIVGRLFGCISQERLQLIAEKVLSEFQCGFHKGRGCVDMIFTVRQLFKKSRDLVSRGALWQICMVSSSNALPNQILP